MAQGFGYNSAVVAQVVATARQFAAALNVAKVEMRAAATDAFDDPTEFLPAFHDQVANVKQALNGLTEVQGGFAAVLPGIGGEGLLSGFREKTLRTAGLLDKQLETPPTEKSELRAWSDEAATGIDRIADAAKSIATAIENNVARRQEVDRTLAAGFNEIGFGG